MVQATPLPEKLRTTFEAYGVIKRVAVPKLDLLDKEIAERKGKWALSKNADGIAVAKVTIQGQTFDGAADESNMALSIAFASALVATQPRQGDLFDQPAEPSAAAKHLSDLGATITVNGKEATTPKEIDAAVGEAVAGAMKTAVQTRRRANGTASNVDWDKDAALAAAGVQPAP